MNHILAIAMMIGMGAQQVPSVSTASGCKNYAVGEARLPNVPQCELSVPYSNSDASTFSVITNTVQTYPTIEIHFTGAILMLGKDEKDQLVFTLYRDGHVEYSDGRAVNENLKFFWKTMAGSYSEELDTMCSERKKQLIGRTEYGAESIR
jgi:hypothetical protein